MKTENNEMSIGAKVDFVQELGELLAKTREGIEKCSLADEDTVIVKYKRGFCKKVNISCDSWLAIIKDVVNRI